MRLQHALDLIYDSLETQMPFQAWHDISKGKSEVLKKDGWKQRKFKTTLVA